MGAQQPQRTLARPVRSGQERGVLTLAGVTAGLAFILDLTTGGWEILLVGLPLLAVCVAHFLVQRLSVRNVDTWSGWAIVPFVLADMVLLEVILLQVHVGDGPAWTTITAIVGGGGGSNLTEPPSWDPGVLLGVLVLMAWGLVVVSSLVRRSVARGLSMLVLAVMSAGLLVPIVMTGRDEMRAQAAAAQTQKAQREALDAAIGPSPPACDGPSVPVHAAVKDSIWEYKAPAVGRAPVWFHIDPLSIEKGHAVLHLGQVYQLERGPSGWKIGMWWLTDASLRDMIHLSITDTSGAPITADSSAPMPDPGVLDPANAEEILRPPVPPYRTYVNTVEFPGTGCYTIKAEWPGDRWSVILAVGK